MCRLSLRAKRSLPGIVLVGVLWSALPAAAEAPGGPPEEPPPMPPPSAALVTADPLSATPVETSAVPPTLPDLPINQSERAAAAAGELDLSAPPAAVVGAAPAGLPREMVSRMAGELQQAIAAFHQELAQLTQRFDQAADEAQALAVQREIETLKAGQEVDFLLMQARYAREAGLTARADELEEIVARIRGAVAAQPSPPATPLSDPPASQPR